MYCVYLHINTVNGKKYCGMTNNPLKRFQGGGKRYKPPKTKDETSRRFWNAILKYGWDNFEHKIIFDNLTFEQACDKEKEIISKLDLTNEEKGYNMAEGGNGGRIYLTHPRGMLGKPQTEYNNKCCRERFLTNNPMNSIVWDKDKPHPRGMLGKKHTEEVRKRISNKLKGKKFSKERNDKISKSLKGRKLSESHLENLRKASIKRSKKDGFRANCSKWMLVEYPNGKKELFKSVTKMKEHIGISQTIYKKLIANGQAYYPKYENDRKRLSNIIGITIKEIENTEITKDLKKFLVL